MRKIVKNRYRFVRSYVCIREEQRMRQGLRLLVVGSPLYGALRWEHRLGAALRALFWEPEQSLLCQLRRQHQQTALAALGLA